MSQDRPSGDLANSSSSSASWRDDLDDGPQASTPGSSDMHIQSDSELEEGGHTQLPVWLRESSKNFRWGWVPVRIRQWGRKVADWSKGPDPPQIQKITPWFAPIQEAIPRFIDRQLPKRRQKVALLGFLYFCWVLTFSLILRHSADAGIIKGYGKPMNIWCGASFW